ncbi:MAG: Secretion system C-terminal sorting domain [Bacteroidota bacterium]|nr:Secretion system C-terminal sorting domain [Bacteroidota bacterium]
MKKLILIITALIAIQAALEAQQSPLLTKEPTTGKIEYIIWQSGINPASDKVYAVDSTAIHAAGISPIQLPVRLQTRDGRLKVSMLRLLYPPNYGDTLLNNVFPVPVVLAANSGKPLDGFTQSESINFDKVDLDSTATQRVVMRNAGNSVLVIPRGWFYNVNSQKLEDGIIISSAGIARSDAIQNREVSWQMRDIEPAPRQGEQLKYAGAGKDNLDVRLNPGDTMSFYLDVLPTVVGRKNDSLLLSLNDGLNSHRYSIPLSILATWTLFFDMGDIAAKPSTASLKGEFIDTIKITHNKGERARISSMRYAVSFDPRNIFIEDVSLNKDTFPDGWSLGTIDLRNNEKNGYIIIEAQADTNFLIKQFSQDPADFSYFTAGTDDTVAILGYVKGLQLLGPSEYTALNIDTNISRHNFSINYMPDSDSALITERLPYISTVRGLITADSLMFLSQRLLEKGGLAAKILNVFPNPAGLQSITTIEIETYRDTYINLCVYDAVTGAKQGDIFSGRIAKPTKRTFTIDVKNFPSGAYLLTLQSGDSSDLWLLNILK